MQIRRKVVNWTRQELFLLLLLLPSILDHACTHPVKKKTIVTISQGPSIHTQHDQPGAGRSTDVTSPWLVRRVTSPRLAVVTSPGLVTMGSHVTVTGYPGALAVVTSPRLVTMGNHVTITRYPRRTGRRDQSRAGHNGKSCHRHGIPRRIGRRDQSTAGHDGKSCHRHGIPPAQSERMSK